MNNNTPHEDFYDTFVKILKEVFYYVSEERGNFPGGPTLYRVNCQSFNQEKEIAKVFGLLRQKGYRQFENLTFIDTKRNERWVIFITNSDYTLWWSCQPIFAY